MADSTQQPGPAAKGNAQQRAEARRLAESTLSEWRDLATIWKLTLSLDDTTSDNYPARVQLHKRIAKLSNDNDIEAPSAEVARSFEWLDSRCLHIVLRLEVSTAATHMPTVGEAMEGASIELGTGYGFEGERLPTNSDMWSWTSYHYEQGVRGEARIAETEPLSEMLAEWVEQVAEYYSLA